MLRICGIGGWLLRAVKTFYSNSRACVSVGKSESNCFKINVGLLLGCVRSLWLFNVYVDWVVREVNTEGRSLNTSWCNWKGVDLN